MRSSRSFVLVALAASCAACVLDHPLVPDSDNPPTPRLVIHGVLMVDSTTQRIVVERARLVSDGQGSNVLPLPDSVVLVTVFDGQGTAHAFTRSSDSAAVFRGSFIVSSGATYRLLVIAGPDTATGVVAVPAKPVLVVVPPDTINVKDSIRFTWRSVSDAGFGFRLVVTKFDSASYEYYRPAVALTADTTVAYKIDPSYAQSDSVLFVLAAIDRRTFEYFGGRADTLAHGGVSTLVNAFGVFGAASVVTRLVWF